MFSLLVFHSGFIMVAVRNVPFSWTLLLARARDGDFGHDAQRAVAETDLEQVRRPGAPYHASWYAPHVGWVPQEDAVEVPVHEPLGHCQDDPSICRD